LRCSAIMFHAVVHGAALRWRSGVYRRRRVTCFCSRCVLGAEYAGFYSSWCVFWWSVAVVGHCVNARRRASRTAAAAAGAVTVTGAVARAVRGLAFAFRRSRGGMISWVWTHHTCVGWKAAFYSTHTLPHPPFCACGSPWVLAHFSGAAAVPVRLHCFLLRKPRRAVPLFDACRQHADRCSG